MAGDWIKFRTSLISDGRVRVSAKKMGLKGNAVGNAASVTVIGGLVTLWSLADEHADEHGVLYGYDPEDINNLVGIPNFCESLHSDWIDISGDWVKLPEYQEHNGQTAKKRAQTAKRVANHKANVKGNDGVTPEALPDALPREEKRREEKKETKRFTPPSVSDVKDYCETRSNTVDPESFHDFYESKGWMVGKNKMKDWKAAVRTWEKKDLDHQKNTDTNDEVYQ